jgi:hypothetical protein
MNSEYEIGGQIRRFASTTMFMFIWQLPTSSDAIPPYIWPEIMYNLYISYFFQVRGLTLWPGSELGVAHRREATAIVRHSVLSRHR